MGAENKLIHLSFSTIGAISRRTTSDDKQLRIRNRGHDLHHSCRRPYSYGATDQCGTITPWRKVLLEKLTGFAANQEIPRILWNPKVNLPHSQAPATCPYPEPTPSSPHNPFPLPEDPS